MRHWDWQIRRRHRFPLDFFFAAHRARAAHCAICRRRVFESFFARAKPPLRPNSLLYARTAGWSRSSMRVSISRLFERSPLLTGIGNEVWPFDGAEFGEHVFGGRGEWTRRSFARFVIFTDAMSWTFCADLTPSTLPDMRFQIRRRRTTAKLPAYVDFSAAVTHERFRLWILHITRSGNARRPRSSSRRMFTHSHGFTLDVPCSRRQPVSLQDSQSSFPCRWSR